MHFSKQQHEQGDSDFDGVYKQHPSTPSAPDMRSSEENVSKQSLPMAIAVPLDSPIHNPRTPAGSQVNSNSNHHQQRHWLASWALRIPALLVFHVLNFVLAVSAFVLVVTLGSLSVGLVPLCCVGVVIFQLLAWLTEFAVELDVTFANMVTPATGSCSGEKLRVHQRITSGFTAKDRHGFISRLTFVAPRTIGAMVYLLTTKFVVGILSCTVAAMVVGGPVTAIVMAVERPREYQFVGFTYADHPVAYVFLAVGMLLLGLVLLPAVASLSWRLTKAVCAEKTQRDGCDA